MTCYNCQKEIVEGSRYCQHCGAAQKPITPPPAPAKPLRRSRKNKVIGGVCGGFADYFGLDVVLVRLIWVLVTILGVGSALIAYLICWIIIPFAEEESTAPVPASQ